MKRNHFTNLQASRGKKLLSDWKKVKVISRWNVFLPLFMNNFIMQKILQKKPRSIILALKVISHLQPLNTHISIHYCTFSIFNQIQTIEKKEFYYLLVWVTSSLRIRWYFNTLCIGTASKSLKRNLPSLAACSHVWTDSRTDSSLEQSVSNNIWAEKKDNLV